MARVLALALALVAADAFLPSSAPLRQRVASISMSAAPALGTKTDYLSAATAAPLRAIVRDGLCARRGRLLLRPLETTAPHRTWPHA